MASNQTPNLKLSQWEADDEVLRADFNADNAKIDAAVAAAADTAQTALETAQAGYGPVNRPFVVGTYVGNAADVGSEPIYQTISLGFAPSYVRVFDLAGYGQYNYIVPSRGLYEADAAPGIPVPYSGVAALEVTEDGFIVSTRLNGDYYAYPTLNVNSRRYAYIAFR